MLGHGEGKSKKQAEQAAARSAWTSLAEADALLEAGPETDAGAS
jgi:dsRNA-specific ribonuclease